MRYGNKAFKDWYAKATEYTSNDCHKFKQNGWMSWYQKNFQVQSHNFIDILQNLSGLM